MAKKWRLGRGETVVVLAALFSCLSCTVSGGWRWPGGMLPDWYFALRVCLFQLSVLSGLILMGRLVKRPILFASLVLHLFLLARLACEYQEYLVSTRPSYALESGDRRVPPGWSLIFG